MIALWVTCAEIIWGVLPQREESPCKRMEIKRPAEYRPLVSMTGSKP